MEDEKAISIPVKDLTQLKVVLAAWYAFLRDVSDNFAREEYARFLKTPVIYDLAKDEIDVMFTGSQELLNEFRSHVLKKTDS